MNREIFGLSRSMPQQNRSLLERTDVMVTTQEQGGQLRAGLVVDWREFQRAFEKGP